MTSRTILNLLFRTNLRSTARWKSTHKVVGTFGDTTEVTAEDRMYSKVVPSQHPTEEKPLVLLFGWAGASQKNLGKYGKVYTDLGCPVVEYILPTKFLFRHVEQAFEALSGVLDEVEESTQKKTIVHCLSDTGIMCFQGLCIAAEMKDLDFKPDGIVWDSCPGPKPEITLPRGVIMTLVNWLARLRDGMSLAQAVTSSWIDLRDLVWGNYLRKRKGLESKISMMDGVWVGYWARDLPLEASEVFIYSHSDLYVKGGHIEKNMIPARQKMSKDVAVCRLEKSPHVGHLRAHPQIYKKCIKDLVEKVEKQH